MADNLLNTSIAAIKTKILSDVTNANAEDVSKLARMAKSVGLEEDSQIETALNTRVESLTTSATVEELSKLAQAIKQVKGSTTLPASTDNLSEGSNNLYYTDARVDARISASGASGTVNQTVSDTQPSSPSAGDLWFDSSDGSLSVYYSDGTSSQWVAVSGPAGPQGQQGNDGSSGSSVTAYANLAAFPSSGNTVGDFAFATDTKAVYIWDGTEWDRINSGGDETPRLTTTPATTHKLNGDGSTSTITIVAEDPEGFPITYSYDTNPSNPNQITSITENNGVFTLTPSTTEAHAGNFALRLKANDGVHITSHAIAVDLTFQTVFTFDTSSSYVNSAYTGDNQVSVTLTNTQVVASQQIGKMGKGYFECKIIQDGSYPMIGIGTDPFTADYNGTSAKYLYMNGSIYGPSPASSGLGATNVNDIIMFAYDTTAEEVWIGKNGSWSSGRDPTAGQSGFSVTGNPSTNGFKPMFNEGSSGGSTYRIEIISHSQGPQYTIPTGWSLA